MGILASGRDCGEIMLGSSYLIKAACLTIVTALLSANEGVHLHICGDPELVSIISSIQLGEGIDG
jgi:hypothetical protein